MKRVYRKKFTEENSSALSSNVSRKIPGSQVGNSRGGYKFSLTEASMLGHKRQTSPGSKQSLLPGSANTGTEHAATPYIVLSYIDP